MLRHRLASRAALAEAEDELASVCQLHTAALTSVLFLSDCLSGPLKFETLQTFKLTFSFFFQVHPSGEAKPVSPFFRLFSGGFTSLISLHKDGHYPWCSGVWMESNPFDQRGSD